MSKQFLMVSALLLAPGLLYAEDCRRADQLYNQAAQATSNQEKLLEQILAICPDHLHGLNNLAVLREQQGKPDQAEALYRKMIDQDENFASAHAGLGDVLAVQGKHREAATAYTAFLDLLAHDRNNPLAAHEPEYRQKLKSEQKKIDTSKMVASKDITQALTTGEAEPKRGFERIIKAPHVDIHIHFHVESDQINSESLAQVEQLAKALQEPTLQKYHFTIEGHTDSVGSSAFNKELSMRRAGQVKTHLVTKYKIPQNRFTVIGRGQDQPIASNDDVHGRALNRRVTIINKGTENP